jgi:hypothetical protein
MTAGYSREQVERAVNAGADLVRDGTPAGERETDLINLVVNAALTLLDQPGLTLDEVMDASYDGGAAEVRSWWGGWS